MKKIIYALILALVGLYILLAVASSSDEYNAERLLYHATRVSAKFAANPDVVPPAMQRSVERDLNIILSKYPHVKVSGMARLALAEFYIAGKKYDKAVSMLNDILVKYPGNENMQSRAQFLKGFAYEKQDKWDRALAEYNLLRKKYPKTQIGLQIPFYIARHYYAKGEENQAQGVYTEAVSFYRALESENRNNIVGYTAASLLVYVYMNLKQYEEAGRTAEEILNNYPLAVSLRDQIQNVDTIYISILKKPQQAIEIFRVVKDKTKDPNAQKFLEKHIEAIKQQILDKK